MKTLPPLEVLHFYLAYDPFAGTLEWRETGEIFGYVSAAGYIVGYFDGEAYFAHRLVFKMMTGTEPEIVDHINGSRTDMRWANLRSVDCPTNARNKAIPAHNTSGHVGVSAEPDGRWRAHICVNKRRITLGRFDIFAAAVVARRDAELKFGFHSNHGRRYNL